MKINKDKYFNVLRKLYDRLRNSNVTWAITGSFGFALQGLSIGPKDIDIQTDKYGAYEIERLFSEFVVKNVHFLASEKIRSHFGTLVIDGIKVEIMGDIEKRIEGDTWERTGDLRKYIRFIEIERMYIPVLSLEYEHQAYLKLGRKDKAEMLRKWLAKEENQ